MFTGIRVKKKKNKKQGNQMISKRKGAFDCFFCKKSAFSVKRVVKRKNKDYFRTVNHFKILMH